MKMRHEPNYYRHESRSGSVSKSMRPVLLGLVAVIGAIFLISAIAAIVVPAIRTVEVAYPHGIVAVITYDGFKGTPIVDSGMTEAEIWVNDCIIDVEWLVPNDDEALAYHTFTIMRFSPEAGEEWLKGYHQPPDSIGLSKTI